MFRIILLANWGLGLEVLRTLHYMADVTVLCVVTQYREESSDPWFNAVHDFACDKDYKIVDRHCISFSDLRDQLEQLDIDLLISHAFMHILPKEVLSVPKYGSVNIHPSLLPRYRGPSPTYWVLKNEELETGLTAHFIDEGIDTGDIITQKRLPLEKGDTVQSVIEKMKPLISGLVIETIERVLDDKFIPAQQHEDLACYAPRPNKMEL